MSEDHEHLENQIRERAFQMWQEAGCPEGRAEEFWYLAREVEEGGGSVIDLPLPHTPILQDTPNSVVDETGLPPASDHGNFA